MVCWLVENQCVPFAYKKFRKCDSFLLTAREFVCLRFDQTRHTKSVEHRFSSPIFADGIAHRTLWQNWLLSEHADACAATVSHDAESGE